MTGHGARMRQAELMFGAGSEWRTTKVFLEYEGFLLNILPSGGFIGLAGLIALTNRIDRLQRKRAPA